jgi:hypothetical protein
MQRLIRRRAYIIGGVGCALALAMSGVAGAQNGTQTLDGEIQGTKNASLRVAVEYVPGSDGLVAHATNVAVSLPSEAKITTKKLPQCDPATLEGTTTADAIAQCGKSQVSTSGSAVADVVGTDLPATVTGFNGTSSGGNPTLLLHSRVDAASLTTVLVGTILPSGGGGPFGHTLNVPVPPLAGGAASIQRFETTVQKKIKAKKSGKGAEASKKKKKKKKSYVSAKCGDGTYSFQGVFDYSDAPQQTATDEQPC